MFEESLLESAHLVQSRSRWPAFASFAVQAAIVAVLVAIPVLHPEVVNLPAKLTELTAPVMPPRPVVIPRVRVNSSTPSTSAPSAPATPIAESGPVISTVYGANVHNESAPVVGTITSMVGSGSPTGLDPALAPKAGGPAVTVAAAKVGPLHISTGVSAGLLLTPIRPIYPPIARASHQQGTVVIHAIISKTGTIESASVVSGPAMLQGAALEAVRVARYRPYLLNGDPTEVDTTFSINFTMQ